MNFWYKHLLTFIKIWQKKKLEFPWVFYHFFKVTKKDPSFCSEIILLKTWELYNECRVGVVIIRSRATHYIPEAFATASRDWRESRHTAFIDRQSTRSFQKPPHCRWAWRAKSPSFQGRRTDCETGEYDDHTATAKGCYCSSSSQAWWSSFLLLLAAKANLSL